MWNDSSPLRSVAQPASRHEARSAAQPGLWQIWPSREQKVIPADKLTHVRPLPLATTIEGCVNGQYCHGGYAGHGNSKVVYRLTNGQMLKLVPQNDQEPEVFKRLQSLRIFPKIHACGDCIVHSNDDVGQPAGSVGQHANHGIWYAWLTEEAQPLDAYLQKAEASPEKCIMGCIRAITSAAAAKHILSDNALFNFGMLGDTVVIIDAGSRSAEEWSKAEVTKKVMQSFWSKAQMWLRPDELNRCQQAWRSAPQTLTEAAKTFEEMYAELCGRAQPAEQPAPPRNVRSKAAGGSAARKTEVSAYSAAVHKSDASQARGSGERPATTPSARPGCCSIASARQC